MVAKEKLEEGMITTNEPGFYAAGSHGIRLENEMLCVKGEKNEFGQFMEFEPITIAPIDLDAINVELMKDIVDVDIEGEDVLDSVGLKKRANQFPAQLSGGEQQRVSIARAVAKQPTMLLCDEPTGALDSNTGVLILNLLQDMSNNKNTTVVIVTHNAVLAEAADKVIRIKNGQIESIVINENPKKIDDLEW